MNQYTLREELPTTAIEDRRELVAACRRSSMTWEKVAQTVSERFGYKISPAMCAEDYRIVMAKRTLELNENLDSYRFTMLDQVDAVIETVLPRALAGNDLAIDSLNKLWTRKAKLLGADAPVRTEVDDKRKLPGGVTPAALLARMDEIRARLSAKLSGASGEATVTVDVLPRHVEPDNLAEFIDVGQPEPQSGLPETNRVGLAVLEPRVGHEPRVEPNQEDDEPVLELARLPLVVVPKP